MLHIVYSILLYYIIFIFVSVKLNKGENEIR